MMGEMRKAQKCENVFWGFQVKDKKSEVRADRQEAT
jgi:hypothetical protein